MEAGSLNHWAAREVPTGLLFLLIKANMLQGLLSGDSVSSERDTQQAGRFQAAHRGVMCANLEVTCCHTEICPRGGGEGELTGI